MRPVGGFRILVLGSLDPEMLEKIGVLVRHRQVRSLIKQAETTRDLTLEQVCLDPDGEVIEDEVHVEIRLEFVSRMGLGQLACTESSGIPITREPQ